MDLIRRDFANEKQSETGSGSTSTCGTYLCQTIAFLNANSDGTFHLLSCKRERLTFGSISGLYWLGCWVFRL
jgi:hypothetical protein